MLETQRDTSSEIVHTAGGGYYNFSVENGIEHTLKEHSQIMFNEVVKLNINIDGLPLSKSSGSQFWPVLGEVISDDVYFSTFTIGIYHGMTKPSNVNEFLKPFVDEMMDISKSGILVNGIKYCN